MKLNISILILLFLTSNLILSQNSKPDYQNNSNLDFTNFLSGVKYAYVALADATVDDISNGKSPANASAILGIIKYLKEIGFDDVKWGKILSSNQNIPSLCDLVIVSPSLGVILIIHIRILS
jgi:hypothetical protein